MREWVTRHRVAAGVASIVLVVLLGAGYVIWTVNSGSDPAPGAPNSTGLEFVEQTSGRTVVTTLARDGSRSESSLRCQRVYSAAGTTVCLRLSGPGVYEAAVMRGGEDVFSTGIPGTPSRARVSASGNIVSWTVFVTGDSYLAPGGFSTRTGYVDLRSRELVNTVEDFTITIDGKVDKRADFNFWGMTVGSDDRTFYATLGSGSTTWLLKGDLLAHTAATVRTGAECPSLSPDQTRVAYKKRTGRLGGWQLVVLDLASGKETLLPGSNGVDDQAAWLDDSTVAYAKPPTSGGTSTIYASAADGTGEARELVTEASSPSPPNP